MRMSRWGGGDGHCMHGMCQHELALSKYCIYMHKNSVRLRTVGVLKPPKPNA